MKSTAIYIQAILTAIGAWLSAKLGILFPVLITFVACMIADYITGYAASSKEALEHPNDPNYGWSSKKGMLGIYKKFGYIFVVGVSMLLDFLVSATGSYIGYNMPKVAIFGLLTAVWYILNEILSIIENAGRMGAPIPVWLKKYIAVLKSTIDTKAQADAGIVEEESDE